MLGSLDCCLEGKLKQLSQLLKLMNGIASGMEREVELNGTSVNITQLGGW